MIGPTAEHADIVECKDVSVPDGQLEEAPNLAQIDRSYWLSADPLPVTEENLSRGKQVFLERCVGCHGPQGDGTGPGAKFMSPPPADHDDVTVSSRRNSSTVQNSAPRSGRCVLRPLPSWS